MPKKDRKNTIADDMMPPPKIAKNRTRNIEASPVAGNALSSQPQSLEICPVSEILQKAQTNQSMHLKYFKALNEMYEKVSSIIHIQYWFWCMRISILYCCLSKRLSWLVQSQFCRLYLDFELPSISRWVTKNSNLTS